VGVLVTVSRFFSFLVTRTAKEQKRVEEEIEKSEELVHEVMAKLCRLRKQREHLRRKTSELFSRGMRELDEEDGVRSQEEAILEEQQTVGDLQSLAHVDVIDWTAIFGEPDPFGGTVATTGGNSSGV
jgi:hypothetical protein